MANRFRDTGIFAASVCVAAQYIDARVKWFAQRMGVQLLHLAPLNAKELVVHDISQAEGYEKYLVRVNRKRAFPKPRQGLVAVNE